MSRLQSLSIFALAISSSLTQPSSGQTLGPTPEEAVRVRVSMNSDGSRTVYRFDNAKHEAVATTTEPDGKPRGKIVYQIGEAGRFASGIAYGPDEKFLFKTLFKYDAAGRLEQETRLAKDDGVINRIAYKYDAKGKQAGYSIFDASGKLISGTASPTPTVTATKPRKGPSR